MKTVAALFVEPDGAYWNLPDVIPWGLPHHDARMYAGPYPVVAHPPCERWGRYWSGGPSAKVRRVLGDDDSCFAAAFGAVCRWGGVLEHPEASHAWRVFGIPRPPRAGGWLRHPCRFMGRVAWTCCVEQGHYGHPARKATWLFYVGDALPPGMKWGPSKGRRLDEGFHSKRERDEARARGVKPRARLSRGDNIATPPEFRDTLLRMAANAIEVRR